MWFVITSDKTVLQHFQTLLSVAKHNCSTKNVTVGKCSLVMHFIMHILFYSGLVSQKWKQLHTDLLIITIIDNCVVLWFSVKILCWNRALFNICFIFNFAVTLPSIFVSITANSCKKGTLVYRTGINLIN